MSNNIQIINEGLAEMAKERAKEAADNFKIAQLTPEEQERFKEIQKRDETVVKETHSDGSTKTIPVAEYASDLEREIEDIKTSAGVIVGKGVHVGDIVKTIQSKRQEEKEKALKAFRELSVINGDAESDGGNISDDEILEINNEAIDTIMKLMKVSRLESSDISKFFRKMSVQQIADALPPRFVHMYLTPQEIKANNIKAKDRVIQTLVYLSITGPEMDYLNEYIDHQNKLMMLSHRIVQAELDMSKVITSKEKLSEIVAKANDLQPADRTSIWAKRLNGDPMAVHNLFAQQAVTMEIMEEAYQKLYEEYKDDYDCRTMVQKQIDECRAKRDVFLSVTQLETMWKLYTILINRLKQDNRNGYKNLMREALNAVDRIRRAKQDVLFPIHNPTASKDPNMILQMYMEQYPAMLAAYNQTVQSILDQNAKSEHPEDTKEIEPIHLDGIDDAVTHQYFSLLLLILYGRIMKSLSGEDMTKYEAIECDCYFKMFCKAGSDVYLMNKIWLMMKSFVQYAIETWPAPKTPSKGKKK